MPAGVVKSKRDERMWKQAKAYVSQSKGKPQSGFSDLDWGLVMKIFQQMKDKYAGGRLPKAYPAVSETQMSRDLALIEAKKKKKKKKKKCLYCYGKGCKYCGYYGWVFAPFFGKGDGSGSAAEISTGSAPGSQGTGPARPGPGGINVPGIPVGPNTGMGASRDFDGNSLIEDIARLSEQTGAEEKAMVRLSDLYFDTDTEYVLKDRKVRGGYISGHKAGDVLKVERPVKFRRADQIGNYLERQVNVGVIGQRLQTAVKVKNIIADVFDGTLLVNNSKRDTNNFKKLARASGAI